MGIAIRTQGLTKRFGRHTAVSNLDLEINEGEVFGLIGPNGAGKTTLIRMLATAEQATTGEIYIQERRLKSSNRNASIKRLIGYLPDDFPLYEDLTVWNYLNYFARLYQLNSTRRKQRLMEVLDMVQLVHKRQDLVAHLSRGMKQRLGLARTIIHEPILLLLDEPVSGLDPSARVEFRSLISTLQEAGMTIIISSHILSDLAELCTSVGIMELGHLVECTSLKNLYQQLSGQQIRISCLNDKHELDQALKEADRVQSWKYDAIAQQTHIRFEGTDNQVSELLESLIKQGIKITNFHCRQDDLETIYLEKLNHKQVS